MEIWKDQSVMSQNANISRWLLVTVQMVFLLLVSVLAGGSKQVAKY